MAEINAGFGFAQVRGLLRKIASPSTRSSSPANSERWHTMPSESGWQRRSCANVMSKRSSCPGCWPQNVL